MRKDIAAFLMAIFGGWLISGPAVAGPDLPDPPDIDLPNPPGPAPAPPRLPRPGETPDLDPLGIFGDDDDHRSFWHPGHHKKHKGKKK